jgi:hypothetical protein
MDIKAEVAAMKKWCEDNYSKGADTMVECWSDDDYAQLLQGKTKRAAWQLLKRLASVYRERQSDADYYAENF